MNGLGAFNWGNLLGSVVGNIIGQTSKPPVVKPPAVAPVAAPAVVAQAAEAKAKEDESAIAKYWPIMAAAGLGVLGIGAVVLLKKRA